MPHLSARLVESIQRRLGRSDAATNELIGFYMAAGADLAVAEHEFVEIVAQQVRRKLAGP